MSAQKKQKMILSEANRSEKYLVPNQPGRVLVGKIGWQVRNRGGQGILPLHTHDVAKNISTKGTSKRRYGKVRLVVVPEKVKQGWLKINADKAKLNPLLPEFKAMSHSGPVYATLICTHFVSACQLILEGGRRYRDDKDGLRLMLKDDDEEGVMIQKVGVDAVVYGPELWGDRAALLGLMREDNLDAEIQRGETEIDAFGHVCQIFSDIVEDCGPEGKIITVDEVMEGVAEIGFGNMPSTGWKQLVAFRLALSKAHADMLFDALAQVCNGRVRTPPETYAQINNLHPRNHQWIKVFLIMETFLSELLSEETGVHKKFTHAGPQPKQVKSLDPKAIKALGAEKELLVSFAKFFTQIVAHYHVDAVEGESVEKRTLANATLMKSLGRVLWKIAEALLGHKKANAAAANLVHKNGVLPNAAADLDKEALVQKIMKDRFADIEKRYENHLEKAGVFAGERKRREPLGEQTDSSEQKENDGRHDAGHLGYEPQ